jgi:putative DNA primase/helicase
MGERKYWVSFGKSRFDTKWKNKEVTWDYLTERFKTASRTQETQAEYFRMSKDEQDRIKDIGGFVGGVVDGGRRSAQTVKQRSLITLDIDNAKPGLWEDIKLIVDYECAMYTTHKHKPEKPRYRLIIPLTRDVTADEYEAIARWLANDIGIDYFDDTTYQPSRLMYWPSYSRDGEFLSEVLDGTELNPDEVLRMYPDWRDTSSWPVSSRVDGVRHKAAEKQGDPTAKPGIVGAFCRVYDVPAAIEKFLNDAYTDAGKGRYTYVKGSTSAGLVLYEDGAFAYSNHGTDPASGKLCNAFDLVRLHLFGEKDAEAKEDTPINRMPSYMAMCEFASKDKAVAKLIGDERTAAAMKDFAEDERPTDADLTTTQKGIIETTRHNVMVLLREKECFDGIYYNIMADAIELDPAYKLPWKRDKKDLRWGDNDDAWLRQYLEGWAKFPTQTVYDGLQNVATSRGIHPVRDYLDNLPEWDGIERVDRLLIEYLNADDCEYVRQVTRKTLCAAVMRVNNPGCKFDTILVLNGKQGLGKSTLANKLACEKWFSDSLSLADTAGKTGMEKLQGSWILEIPEMNGMRKADIESLRSFISRRDDQYRAAYARRVTPHPRQCIFIGTTNAEDNGYLRDLAGNRRFWDVRVRGEEHKTAARIFKEITQDYVDQLWAEVKVYVSKGESLVLIGDVLEEAQRRQRQALEKDPRMGQVQEYLDTPLPKNWYERTIDQRLDYLHADFKEREKAGEMMQRERVCNQEIWVECFHRPGGSMERKDSDAIAGIMRQMDGWEKGNGSFRISGYGKVRYYERSQGQS